MKMQISDTAWMEYDDVGAGTPVVLLHAFPLSRAMWQPQREALRSDYRLLLPDLRGFGGTSPFDGPPSVEQMADDVVRLLDALNLTEPMVLGGLSMGGYVALAFARKHPARLRALVLADTKAEPDDTDAKANRDKLIAFAQTHLPQEVIEQLLPKLLGAETALQRPQVAAEVRRLAALQTPEAIVGALRMLRDRPDARPTLGSIRVPTLVVVGKEDALTPPEVAERLATGISGARLEQLPGAGHLSNLEQPALFNAALRSFLQSLSAY